MHCFNCRCYKRFTNNHEKIKDGNGSEWDEGDENNRVFFMYAYISPPH